MNTSDSRLPAALTASIGLVKDAVAEVARRVVETLHTLAQSATSITERDALLSTQMTLKRKLHVFRSTFDDTFDERIQTELQPTRERGRRKVDDWQTLTLVDDSEVEERMYSDRISQQISHTCEWQLRDVAAYMGKVLEIGRADEDRNPVRAEVIGVAVYRGIEAVAEETPARLLLAREFGQGLAQTMPACYEAIVRDLQARKILPVGLTLKTVEGPGHLLPGLNSGYESMRDELPSTHAATTIDTHRSSGYGGAHSRRDDPVSSRGGRSTLSGVPRHGAGTARSGVSPQSDAQLMDLLRRLSALASRSGGLDDGARVAGSGGGTPGVAPRLPRLPVGEAHEAREGDPIAVNLIRAHREELMQASTGKLDHVVIDVVGSLFDQILSDPRVPPQMARQIARLQLPVLRVAMADPSFFSSRRHPVRRFVNRIASLACAFDDFADGPGLAFLTHVSELVADIVGGDFGEPELYAEKLSELEAFISAQAAGAAEGNGTSELLEGKEAELRLQQRTMQQLQAALSSIAMPDWLREFAAQVWSQALVGAAREHGADAEMVRRFRAVGRDLVLSVQPKGSPMLRKRFLMHLPTLMKDLNEGLARIGWPQPAQTVFFGKLLPAHAESLKAAPMSELDYNLLGKQLEGIFNQPLPGDDGVRIDTASSAAQAASAAPIEVRFTAEEAQQVGLVAETAVDWSPPSADVDIDLTAAFDAPEEAASPDTEPAPLQIDVDLGLATPDPGVAARGPELMDHLRVGFAYQMLLRDQWQKVRLNYVSPARTFFVFTRGHKQQETLSFTSRMLARLCEADRLRSVENAYLLERATARARKQLAAMRPGG